jgi:hypothetical protein
MGWDYFLNGFMYLLHKFWERLNWVEIFFIQLVEEAAGLCAFLCSGKILHGPNISSIIGGYIYVPVCSRDIKIKFASKSLQKLTCW